MSDATVSRLDSWQANVLGAVASGVLTTVIRPADLNPALLRATHVGMGLVGLATGALAESTPEEEQIPGAVDSRTLASRAGWGAGIAALSAAASVGGVWADGAIERALVRRGVRRPRVWMGVAAAGVTLAVWALEPKEKSRRDERDPEIS